jgi:pimeloyl-ACP methyl ester carboxylesterase
MLLAGCCTAHPRAEIRAAALPPCRPAIGIVFVANGSGDFRTVSTNLGEVLAATGTPLQLETVEWSHGFGRYLVDHLDHCNHLEQGALLAARISALRQSCPGTRIYLVGHSAGCAVVLAAAEYVPPDSIDRIVLLAPSVCTSYDLRPALRAARCGIDTFHSDRDSVILGLGMRLVGTADHCCRVAAGEKGFVPVVACDADAALYSRLRQHPWDPVVAWSGHQGGHYGTNRTAFLQAYVLPLLRAGYALQ